MQRKFLEGLQIEGLENGLPKEIIDSIMNENGKDVEATKTKLSGQIENLQSELNSKDEMLNNVNSEIEKYKGMDIESIKKSATEWEEKYKNFETQSKADKEAFEKKLQDQQYEFAVKEFVGQHNFTSDFTKNAFIEDFKKQGLKLNEGKFLGAEDYIKQFQEKNQGVFVIKEAPSNEPAPPQFTTAATQTTAPKTKMNLMEAMKRANAGEKIDFNQLNIEQPQ